MKKIIIILMLSLTLFSCSKDKTEPTPPPPPPVVDCHCGRVQKDGGSWTISGVRIGWRYVVYNHCTNAPLQLNLNRPIEGDEYCLTYQW